MLLLHTDVLLTTREIVIQRTFGKLRAGPGPPQIATAVLLHRDLLFFFFFIWRASLPRDLWDKEVWGKRVAGVGAVGNGEMGEKGREGGGGGRRGRSTNLRLSASPASVKTSR